METVECIVVGGGLAGLSAAYGLAAAGMEVMVLERGDYSGAKNVTGGRLYVKPIRGFYPELWDEAPFERPVARELVTMMGGGAHTTVEIASDRFLEGEPQSYTVVRAKLDQWLAEKVTEKGAMVVPNMKVDELLRKDGRVVGIKAGDDEIGAGVVVVAEGVLRLLSSAAGLAAEPQARHHALGYKEIIELPAGVIQDRWNLNEGEGAAQLFMGAVTRGMLGGGFLYTNKDSIAIGIGCMLSDLSQHGITPYQLLEGMKRHPMVKPLIAGAEMKEYAAHLIPEGGYKAVPKLYGDGWMMVGDSAGLVNGVHREGSNLAMTSGRLAAQTLIELKDRGAKFDARGLAAYKARLDDSYVMKDMKKYAEVPDFMHGNAHVLDAYPSLLNTAAREMLIVDGVDKRTKQGRILADVREKRSLLGLIGDAYRFWRAFR